MAQHDYDIANQDGAAFRADINAALAAIVSQNSAATEPATTFAYQFWADTTAGKLKQRNAANSAWITLLDMATGLNLDIISQAEAEAGSATTARSWTAQRVKQAILANSLAVPDGLFYKLDASSVVFNKTGAGTMEIKAGTKIWRPDGQVQSFATATAITMPTLVSGTDYAIYICNDGTVRADSSYLFPSGYSAANSRMIGGFHYSLIAPATTVAGGSFATSGSGMIWTQPDVDSIAGINKFSIWDLKYRPACSSPKGMALVNGRTWVDIYLCSTDTAANGTSKYNTNIASGTVLPKIPAEFGGNGSATYSAFDWWAANEICRANQKRLLLASEFYAAAFGVTESQSIDATASTYPTAMRNAGYTSKWGLEQASGVHYTWGQDSAGSASAWVANGGRGQSYNNSVYRVILGGSRTYGSNSGSRCSNWSVVASDASWSLGMRAACDHLQLV